VTTPLRKERPGLTLEQWRHAVEIAAFVAAGLWAFYVFVYEQRLKPLSEPPVLESTIQVQPQPLRNENTLLTVTLVLKNIGSPTVKVDGTIVNVYGVRYGHLPDGHVERSHVPGFGVFARSQPVAERRLLASLLFGPEPPGGKRTILIDPGDDVVYYPHTVIASDRYDAVFVDFAYCYQRADNRTWPTFQPRTLHDGAYDIAALATQRDASRGVLCTGYTDREFAL
jgi:hypothetical protein